MKSLLSIAILLLLSLMVVGQDQTAPIKVPQVLNRGFGMVITPYTDRPPDITLVPHGQDARRGNVWIQNVGWGLLIVGEVDGPPPDLPRNKNLILEKDHMEIWLADGKDPELPPVGWSNQFGETPLPKGAESCADWAKADGTVNAPAEEKCRRWAETQSRYRTYFKRLFVRQWLVTPDYAVESFASPAYDEIMSRFASDQPANEEIPTVLKPQGKLQMWPGHGKNGVGYTFEIMIPFEAFPPLSATDLRDLRLLVDVFNPPALGRKVGAYSTSSAARVYGRPETFNRLRFDPPQQFHITSCDLPLASKDKYGDGHAAWFMPRANQSFDFERNAFIVVNEGKGYQYEPEALSPTAHPAHYFWHVIGENEWVCGPNLTYRKGDKRQSFGVDVDEDGFDAHRLPGGDLLIKVGPRVYGSAFGSGQCGACPRTELRVFRLNTNMKIQNALELGRIVDTDESQDFTVSPDWSQVVQYDRGGFDEQGKPGVWTSTTWCLGESKYEQCGHKDNVQPPEPPVLKELRNAD